MLEGLLVAMERRPLQLQSAAQARRAGNAIPQYHSNVAKGPDGSRGFAVRRTRLSYPAIGVSLPYIFRCVLREPASLTAQCGGRPQDTRNPWRRRTPWSKLNRSHPM